MRELAGKGKRVIGSFVLMIGAGVILDSHVLWVGVAIMLIGALAFIWGLLAARPGGLALPQSGLPESTPIPTQPTESQL